jgi:hypothetical protein
MTSLNIETPSLPFDPTRIRIDAPGQSDGRKRRFGNGACNVESCSCNRFTGSNPNICDCGHSWYDHK